MNAFPDPIPEHPDDVVIDVQIGMATGAGNEIGKVKRRIVVPMALARGLVNQAEQTIMAAIDREALQAVRLAVIREVERRNPEGFYRRLDTLHPDWMFKDDVEERQCFLQIAEHVSRDIEIAAED